MSEILLVNPRKRRRRAAKTSHRRKRRHVAKRVRRRRRSSAVAVRRRRRNPIRMHSRRRRRRNPIGGVSMRGVQGQVMSAGKGALGALALDVAFGYIPVPVALATGMVKYLTRGAAAIILGMVAKKVTSNATAHAMAEGALIVTLHDAAKEAMMTYAPSVRLGEYMSGLGYYGSGYNPGWKPGSMSVTYGGKPAAMHGMDEYMSGYAGEAWTDDSSRDY